ncbi:MAG: ABC transporter permease [Actinomycetota bacterium]|nr:ABC transporter permease [Actinomycetota bacterium]
MADTYQGRIQPRSAPSPIKAIKSLFVADFLVLTKSSRALIAAIMSPVYVLVISRSSKAQAKLGGSPFLLTLSVTLGLLSLSLISYTLMVARDRERGVFQRLRVTPAPTWTIMASCILKQVVVSEVLTEIVLIVSSQLLHINITFADYPKTMLIALLEAFVFLAIAQSLVGLLKSATTVSAVGSFLFATPLLTGLLGVSGVLGETFQSFAKWTPVGTIMAIFQAALSQTQWDEHTSLALLACFGYIVVFGFIGVRYFKWDAR